MVIPVGQPLRDALEAAKAKRKAPAICTNSRGRPWTRDGFKPPLVAQYCAAHGCSSARTPTRGTTGASPRCSAIG
jgi:hypothetical protein